MISHSMRTLLALSSVVVLLSFAQAANAGSRWRVVDTAGSYALGGENGAVYSPVAVTPNQELPANSWVETSAGGRVVLARGTETIMVEPNSRVQLPDAEVNGNTQILQSLGSAIYRIGKQQKPHFQVNTPYLAAVVKGTSFTVTVNDETSSVEVSEGLVEVATLDRSDIEFVRAGFTATIAPAHPDNVVIEQSKHQDSSDTPAAPAEKPAIGVKDMTSVAPVSIPVALGDVVVDVKTVSEGLAFGAVTTAAINPVAVLTDGARDAPLKLLPIAESASETGTTISVQPPAEVVPAPAFDGLDNVTQVVPVKIDGNDAIPELGMGTSGVGTPNLGAGNGNGSGTPNLGAGNGNGRGTPNLGAGNGNGNGGGVVPVVVEIVRGIGGL